jgi:sugar lactone lactonase YvrE
MAGEHYDVFLSYSSPDGPEVEKLALRLEDEANLRVFLDKWRLVPGQAWIPELERALAHSRSCAVFVGKGETRPWQNQEMQAALQKASRSSGKPDGASFGVIPVLLPGARPLCEEETPGFLALRTWIDFRTPKGIDDEQVFGQLVAGIRGIAPGRPVTMPSWIVPLSLPDLRRPTGIAVDGDALIVSDHESGTVTRFERGQIVKQDRGLLKPHHLATTGDALIATDTGHNALIHYALDLVARERTTSLGDRALRRPHGLASNYPGEFYLTDADNHRVLRVQGGDVTASAGKPGCRDGIEVGEFSVPCGVGVSPDCVYVADTYNHRVQVLTRDLRALSSFGSMGNGHGQFAYPVGVAAWQEWVVVADEHNKRLQLWRREAMTIPFAVRCIEFDLCGRWLGSPFGLCFNEDGQLFVTDRKYGQVLRIDFDPMLATIAADGGVRP